MKRKIDVNLAKLGKMKRLRLDIVKDAILTSLSEDCRSLVLEEFLKSGAQVYLVAGAVRDAIASYYEGGGDVSPRDYDIAVSNLSREDFDSLLFSLGKRNRHGGYLLNEEQSPSWDLWRLEESIGLRKTGTPVSIENMLRTFNLNCNAIALDIRTGVFIDGGAIESIRDKCLGFAENAIMHSETTFSAKALLLELGKHFTPGTEMVNFVAGNLEPKSLLHEARKVFPGLVTLRPQLRPRAESSHS